MLAGYRFVLVDEYRDIDRDQYALISALTDRVGRDPEAKLSILAVGDDDQNIYAFRGANVEFIRRFQTDYRAACHYLLDNYRSTAHIIAAANQLIAHNRDRMKIAQPIGKNSDAIRNTVRNFELRTSSQAYRVRIRKRDQVGVDTPS